MTSQPTLTTAKPGDISNGLLLITPVFDALGNSKCYITALAEIEWLCGDVLSRILRGAYRVSPDDALCSSFCTSSRAISQMVRPRAGIARLQSKIAK